MGIRSKVVRHTAPWLFMLCVPAALQTGCGSQDAGVEDTSTSALALTVAGGVTLSQFSYTINDSAGKLYRGGTIPLDNSTEITTVVSGIPAAKGYQVLLTATDSTNPAIVCTGAATFDITPLATTPVRVNLSCHEPVTTGSVAINGSVNVCPVHDGLTLDSSEVFVGSSVTLVLGSSDADNGPSALTYTWAASGGTLTPSSNLVDHFTCTAPGVFSVTVTLSDGDPACDSSATQYVKCTPVGSPSNANGASPFCGDGAVEKEVGEQCDDGNLVSGDGCSATCQIDDNPNTPGDDRPGYVACGQISCGPGTVCCSSNVCTAPNGCNMPGQLPCDGPEDCGSGAQCFLQGHLNGCAVVFYGVSKTVACHTDADCNGTGNGCSSIGTCHS